MLNGLLLLVAAGSVCFGLAVGFVLGIAYAIREQQADEAERRMSR